jgi:ribose 5-phosphate isomerase B
VPETKFCFKKIGIAADHAGSALKGELVAFLQSSGMEPVDYGVSSYSTERVDYPDFVARLAEAVSQRHIEAGIAICGTGIGMSIVANKFMGVRAVCVWDEYSTRMSRAHNDANILCLGGRILTSFRAKDLLALWLSTPFEGGQHKIRIEKIDKIEKRFFNPSRRS